MPFEGTIQLSAKHTKVRWPPCQEACELVYFGDQKIALYELDQRLRQGLMGC